MKNLILVIVLLLTPAVGSNLIAHGQSCPAGSYEIDQGVCKKEPTGCPYGDSIPLDSPKCVPPNEPVVPVLPTQPNSNDLEPTQQSNFVGGK